QTRWSVPPPLSMPNSPLLRALARAVLAGEATAEQIVVRCTRMLGRSWRWLPSLSQRYVETFAGRARPRSRDVVQFLLDDPGFEREWSKRSSRLSVKQWLTEPQRMQPVDVAAEWDIPAIESAGALADWLLLTPRELEWFADLKGLGYKKNRPRLRHYHYRVLAKRSGAVRLIEAPKARLKAMQRQILAGILEKIPHHPAAHGFLKGRSIKTFLAPHVGQRVVLRMDLQDFFPSFGAARIQTVFRTMGYPESVA